VTPRHPALEVHASDTDGCARRFQAVLLEGLDTSNEPAKIGTAVHAAAEAILLARAQTPIIDALAVGAAEIRKQATRLDLAPGSVFDALDILERVLAPDSRISLWPDIGWSGESETRWGLVDDGESFVYVPDPDTECDAAGTMDLVQWQGTTARLDDYKTKRGFLSSQDAYDSWQLRLYAFALLRRFPRIEEVDVGFLMLRHGYRASAILVRGDPWEEGVALRIRTIREERRRILDAGRFPETPGPWCHYCPVLFRCEAQRAAAEQGASALAGLDDSEAARLWLGAKALVTALDKHVRGAFDASDCTPIPLNDPHGTVLGFKPIAGVETLQSYERTMERLRQFGMSRVMEAENFRFVAAHHFAGRVRDVLKELRVGEEIADELVTPVAKQRFTTFVPDPVARELTLEELEARFDRLMGA